MNSPVVGLRAASIIFGLASIGQLLRLLFRLEILIAGHLVPLWLSGVAVPAAAGLCWWLWKLSAATASAVGPRNPDTGPNRTG